MVLVAGILGILFTLMAVGALLDAGSVKTLGVRRFLLTMFTVTLASSAWTVCIMATVLGL